MSETSTGDIKPLRCPECCLATATFRADSRISGEHLTEVWSCERCNHSYRVTYRAVEKRLVGADTERGGDDE